MPPGFERTACFSRSIMNATPSITPLPDLPMTLDGVRIERLLAGKSLPLVAQPTKQNIGLAEWAKKNTEIIDTGLLTSGAVLFRGFGTSSVDSFRRFTDAVITEYIRYEFNLGPRLEISDLIYKSSLYPADLYLAIHNECSAQRTWPRRIAFCCTIPAERGGETPLADCRKALDRLTPEVREKLTRLGIMYVRDILNSELDGIFGTNSKSTIEEYCKRNDYEFEWDRQGGIHLQFVAQVVREHPVTAEQLLFNIVHLYLLSRYSFIGEPQPIPRPVAGLPYERSKYNLNACFGDGSPIDDETVFQVHNAYITEAVEFSWQKGDILLLDNMLIAHGRGRFSGDREVLLAMGNPYHSLPAFRGMTARTTQSGAQDKNTSPAAAGI